MAYFNNLKIGNNVEFMGEFTLNSSTKTESGIRLLRDYSQVKYDLVQAIDPSLTDTIPHGYVAGSKIGLIKGSTYTVSMYTDTNVLLQSQDIVAVDSPIGGVMLPLSSLYYIIDGVKYNEATTIKQENADGEIEEVFHPESWELGEGYWVPHNQYFISNAKNSVWFKIEGFNESGMLTREENSTIPLPIEALPKEIQKVFSPKSTYSQIGFRADPAKGIDLGEFTYFPKSLGLKVGNEYQLGFASPTDEWEPILFQPTPAAEGNVPGSVMIFPSDLTVQTTTYSTRSTNTGSGDNMQDIKDSLNDGKDDKNKAKDSSKDFSYETLMIGLISDYCQINSDGSVIGGEGCIMASALFSDYDQKYVKDVLIQLGIWEQLSSEQQEILLNEAWVPVLIGEDVNGNPLQEISSKVPTLELNITGVASSLGGLKKSVRDLNRMCGQRVDSVGYLVEDYEDQVEATYGEVFNDYSIDKGASFAGPYTTRMGLKYFKDLNIIITPRYTEEPEGWDSNTKGDWNKWVQVLQTNNLVKDDDDNIEKQNDIYKDFFFNTVYLFTAAIDDTAYPTLIYYQGTKETDDDNNLYIYLSEDLASVQEAFPDSTITLWPVHASMGLGSYVDGITNCGMGVANHTHGSLNINWGDYSFVSGLKNLNDGDMNTLLGEGLVGTSESHQTVIGAYNNREISDGIFIVGGGTEEDQVNLLTLSYDGNLNIAGELSSSGADYAEYYEWADGNPNNEDRTGHFVTFASGSKIRLAQPDDAYVLGIVSAAPTVVGNSHKEQWQGKYMRDVYGRILIETIEHEEEIIRSEQEEVLEIIPAYTETKPILNPDYDPIKEYIGRDKRPEWSPVGTHGQLVVLDDGTCQVDSFCALGSNGMATAAAGATPYRVIERLDDTHVKVVLK